MRLRFAAALLVPLLAAAPAAAHEFHRVGDIVVEQPWSRATAAKVGGAFVTLRNNGALADRLVKVSTPLAEKAELHETKVENGVATMRPVDGVEIKPRGGSVQLKPGGVHVMLLGLVRPLKEGERIKLTFTFERAGAIEVEARVEKAGAAAPGAHEH
jgi:copper(I)-binding protein